MIFLQLLGSTKGIEFVTFHNSVAYFRKRFNVEVGFCFYHWWSLLFLSKHNTHVKYVKLCLLPQGLGGSSSGFEAEGASFL